MKEKLFDKLLDENKYEELSFENLNDVMTRIKDEDKEYNYCIIFDDMGAYLKNKETKIFIYLSDAKTLIAEYNTKDIIIKRITLTN